MRKAIFCSLLVLALALPAAGQIDEAVRDLYLQNPAGLLSGFDVRYDAYFDYDLPGSTILVEMEARRPEGNLNALLRVSYKFFAFSAVQLSRIEFLEPAELRGDIYLTRVDGREREVFFWNPELFEPINVEGDFEVFGDANVFEIVGYRLGDADYLIDRISLSDLDPDQFQEAAAQSEAFNIASVYRFQITRVVEYDLVPRPERRDHVVFPNVKVIALNYSLPYEIQLSDADGDLLHTLRYDLSSYKRYGEIDPYMTGGPVYAAKTVVENHVLPGHTTTLTIRQIEIENLSADLFDPDKLGR